ncbi:hypothetical protein DL98DRAFT_650556 [Cadophora sp. DSE1049]|nr:hypothetical protein DL98DRAFT_650556 [Cadophora sp. DSE1049]
MSRQPQTTLPNSISMHPPLRPQLNRQPTSTLRQRHQPLPRACDLCYKRSISCSPNQQDGRCQNCVDLSRECTYNRSRGTDRDAGTRSDLTNSVPGAVVHFRIPEMWEHVIVDSKETIQCLMEVYFKVVYPIFPLFHRPSMTKRIMNEDYITDRSFFACTMALCALASARARDGALFPGRWDSKNLRTSPAAFFFGAAQGTMPRDLCNLRNRDWMRTCGLLALYGIQVGNVATMHRYLGMYHSLVSMDILHNEKSWPKDLGIVETELMRRLFWSMYGLEVYSSIVGASIIRLRESQCSVAFPPEIDDDDFSDSDDARLNSSVQHHNDPSCWIHGWNFTTRIYFILENVMDDHRRRRAPRNRPSSTPTPSNYDVLRRSEALDEIRNMYNKLPQQFREPQPVSPDVRGCQDYKIGFQAATIAATMQLAQLIISICADDPVEKKCAVAHDLRDMLNKIPPHFLRASSCPLIYHVAGLGHILASDTKGRPLFESSYCQVRDVLLCMKFFLSGLEDDSSKPVGAASLSRHIFGIEQFIKSQTTHESVMNGATSIPFVSSQPPPIIGQPINPVVNPGLGGMMGPFSSGMPNNNITTEMNPYGALPMANFSGSGIDQMQVQPPQEFIQNFSTQGDASQGFGGNGADGGLGTL